MMGMVMERRLAPGAPPLAFPPAPLSDDRRVDPDLDWIMTKLVERTFADAGVLARGFADGRPPAVLVATGALAADRSGAERLARYAAEFAGTDRRRAAEGVARLGWDDVVIGGLAHRALAIALPGDGRERTVAALAYSPGSPVAEKPAGAMAERLAPVLDGYFRLWRRHRADQRRLSGLTAALDLSGLGIIVLDTAAEPVFVNRSAEALLERGDGLRRAGRSIAATDLGGAMRLQVAIHHVGAELERDAAGPRRAPILELRRSGARRPLIATVLPVRPAPVEPADAAIVLYVINPDADLARLVTPVCKLYALSPVECRLVVQLAMGATLAEAAISMRVKEQTARAYLKQIFVKTGTNRQTDLVRLMLSSMVNVSSDAELITI